MAFYTDIEQIGESLPSFTKSAVCVEKSIDEANPQELYQCHVCRSRFIYITSFVRTCSRHLSEMSCLLDMKTDEPPIKKEVRFDQTPLFDHNFSSEDGSIGSTEDSYESECELLGSCYEMVNSLKRSLKKKKRREHSRGASLPKNTVLCCPICEKPFLRRQTYRDHMDAHENPLIKCCTICTTEFSSGINANKHKKKFHPELYEHELKERAAERAKDGRRRNRLQPILIPIDKKGTNDLLPILKTKIDPFRVTTSGAPRLKRIKIVVERICLPGFLTNDWIYLPKKEEDYPWIVQQPERIKIESQPNDVIRQENYRGKQEPIIEEDDYEWPDCNKVEYAEKGVTKGDQIPLKDIYRNKPNVGSSYFIRQDEIPHVPQFRGSKYIFGVYSERRNIKLKAGKKKKKSERSKRKRETPPEDDAAEDFLRPLRNYYKNDSKTCKICGVTRSNSNIRRHVAKHCVEEDDRECRIVGCEASFTAANKLREHYSRVHKMKFREYLYNIQKEKMEILEEGKKANLQSVEQIEFKSYLCDICYTNMKTEDDLRYHVEMLHCYKESGGKIKGSLECNICGKSFAAVQNRNLHIRRIHKQILDGSVFCHYCGKDFMGKGFLLSHFRYAHFDKNGVFKEMSTVVKKRYKHPPKEAKTEDIAQHYQKYKVHSVCEICGLIKESRFAMMRHRYEKHGVVDPGYSKIIDRDREENDCKFCGKHFTSLRKWKDHEKYHLKEIPNLHCQICGAKCKTETYLKAHLERHGEKKFFCDYEGCGKSFAVKHDVKIHKRRAHCDDLDYVCKLCGTAFRTWNYRRYHEETVHGLVKVKQLRNKRRPLPQVAAALQHQQLSNPEAEQNTIDDILQDQTFETHALDQQNAQTGIINFNQFSTFQETEERDCQYCGKHFDDYRKWQNHEYYHKKINPDLACEICGAKCKTEYYLKAHRERHGEIQYFCEYPGCGKGFSVKHDVKIHQRRAHKDMVQDGNIPTNISLFHETTGSIPIVVLPSPTLLYPYGPNTQMK